MENKIVTSISSKYDTKGHSPYLVITADLEKYVLKTPNHRFDKESLTKEFLCSHLLNSWLIPTPRITPLILSEELRNHNSFSNDKSFSFSNVYFGSNHISSSIDLQDFITGRKSQAKRISNLNSLLNIALFDIWVANDDRKPSNNNLLLTPFNNYLTIQAIDHAYTFESRPFNELDPKALNFSINDSILYSPLGKNLVKSLKLEQNLITNLEKSFYICISKTKKDFQKILNSIPEDLSISLSDKSQIQDFLFGKHRNKQVFSLFNEIIIDIIK